MPTNEAVTRRRRLTLGDFERFAAVSGDVNPIHLDPDFAAATTFGRPVAHGMLLYSLAFALCRHQWPAAWPLSQSLMFPAPTFAGEEVEIRARRLGQAEAPAAFTVAIEVRRADGQTGLVGQGLWSDDPGKRPAPTPGEVPAVLSSAGPSPGALIPGRRATRTEVIDRRRCLAWGALAGDAAPLRPWPSTPSDSQTVPVRPVLPAPMLGGLISMLLGTGLPGAGTNWLKQTLAFPAPASVGRPVTTAVQVVRVRPEKMLVNLCTTCHDDSGALLCSGEALVKVQDAVVNG